MQKCYLNYWLFWQYRSFICNKESKTVGSVTLHQPFLSVDSTSSTLCTSHWYWLASFFYNFSLPQINQRTHQHHHGSTFSYMIAQDSLLKVHRLFAAFFLVNSHTMHCTLSIQIQLHLHIKNWMVNWFEWFMAFIDFLLVELFSFNIAL